MKKVTMSFSVDSSLEEWLNEFENKSKMLMWVFNNESQLFRKWKKENGYNDNQKPERKDE